MFNFTRRSNLSNHQGWIHSVRPDTTCNLFRRFGRHRICTSSHVHGFFLLRVRAEAYRKRRRSPVAWGELRARWKAMVWRQKVASSYGCSSPKTPQNISTYITQYVIHILSYSIILYPHNEQQLSSFTCTVKPDKVACDLAFDSRSSDVASKRPLSCHDGNFLSCSETNVVHSQPRQRRYHWVHEGVRPARKATAASWQSRVSPSVVVPWYGMIWFGHPAPKSQGETSLKSLRCNLDDSDINLMPAGVNANCLWSLTIFWPRFIGISTWLRGLALLFPGTQNTIEHVDLNEPDHFCRK